MDKEQDIRIIPILALYSAAALILLIGWQIILPPEALPLPIYWFSWPVTGGFVAFINLFPAMLFSAIASSFAVTIIGELEEKRFSPHFFSRMVHPLVTIIGATALYGLLLLLVQPMLHDARYRMETQGQLFKEAKDRAAEEIARENWEEAALHLAICERIWEQSSETQELRDKLAIARDKERAKGIDMAHPAPEKGYMETSEGVIPLLPGHQGPLTVREALDLAETNLNRGNNFDAHWYATVAKKMAKPGSPEEIEATKLATKAWNAIGELKPTPKEEQAYWIYKEKLNGYNAILSGEWIQAYYIFHSLSKELPSDPDVKKYLENALAGIRKVAFFQDEAVETVGETLSHGLFTIPIRDSQGASLGLATLKIDSLTLLSDVAYGVQVTYQTFRPDGTPMRAAQSAYAKLTPFTEKFFEKEVEKEKERLVETEKHKTLLLLKAIDRNDKNKSWDPVWSGAPEGNESYLMLDIPFEDFLLASQAQTNNRNLSILELFRAQQRLPLYGFIPQTFQMELLNRIMDPFLCLVLGIVVLTLSWRLRPRTKPGFVAFPMFLMLPLVSYLVLEGSRMLGTIVNAALLLNFSMGATLAICILKELLLLFLAVLFLAGQRG